MLSCFSCVQLFATPRTVACQATLSMGFSRPEYWSGLPFPENLPNTGTEPVSLMSPALAHRFFTNITNWEALNKPTIFYFFLITYYCYTFFFYICIINLTMFIINGKLFFNKILKIEIYLLHLPICLLILFRSKVQPGIFFFYLKNFF